MRSRSYEIVKAVAMVWLPAAGTLYFALAGIWGFPFAEEIVGSIVSVDAFLGAVLHFSDRTYKTGGVFDGALVIDQTNPAKDIFRIDPWIPVEDIPGRSQLRLKITRPTERSRSRNTPSNEI